MSIAKDPAPVLTGRRRRGGADGEDGFTGRPRGSLRLPRGYLPAHVRGDALEDEGANAVRLMTLHASKGLEFDTVLITGCEDKLIPFKTDDNTGRAEDEEVRLFYVGLTRAKRKLFCRAFRRQRFGRTDYDPSPFLTSSEARSSGRRWKGRGGRNRADAAASSQENRSPPRISRRRARVAMGNSPALRRGSAAAAVVGGGYGYGTGTREGPNERERSSGSPGRSGASGWRRSTQRRRRGARRGEHRRRRKRRRRRRRRRRGERLRRKGRHAARGAEAARKVDEGVGSNCPPRVVRA